MAMVAVLGVLAAAWVAWGVRRWHWRRRPTTVPAEPARPLYQYRPGMERPDARHDAVPGREARAREDRIRGIMAADAARRLGRTGRREVVGEVRPWPQR